MRTITGGTSTNKTLYHRKQSGTTRPSFRIQAARASLSQTGEASRGVLILPGLGNNTADYEHLGGQLSRMGMTVQVAQVSRLDWGRNAAAILDVNWWRGTLKPRPAVDWYLKKVDAAMQDLKRQVEGAPITILTHSAGGWLGRVYLLDFGVTGVDRYVSLGSPHCSAPPGTKGIVDQTRGILTYIGDSCPGAFHPTVAYTTIAGRFVQGVDLTGKGSILAKFAGLGYQQVCGQVDVWGDFIVPESAAHLDGATQVTLEGVFHSPLGEKLPFFGPWYGSESVVPMWSHHLTGSDVAPPVVINAATATS